MENFPLYCRNIYGIIICITCERKRIIMNYQDLKEFAAKLNIGRTEIPLNAIKLANQLNIPCGNEDVAIVDFKGKNNPLWEYPACLYIDEYGKRKIYYNSKTRFWNFYLMHEVAHWLLGHTRETYLNEIEADLLACVLLVSPQIIKDGCKNAYRVCKLCNIPVEDYRITPIARWLLAKVQLKPAVNLCVNLFVFTDGIANLANSLM